ncbi:MAG: tetratricopeptide repeat protein [Candidatus Omnitrophica bacterium]|nr:tetratricopeptide repeat protein [Candidatus Omnitrophota bacterium]
MEKTEHIPLFFRNKKLLVLLLALLTFSVYANAIQGTFVWDDQTLVVQNESIKSFENIPYIFANEFVEKAGYGGNIYRPLQEFSYMVDYFLWGFESVGFHITSIALHIACVVALFCLILRISGSNIVAFITAGFFGVHPINTEAISYISGRSDPLFFLFLVLAFLFYIKSREKKEIKGTVYYLFALLYYALSLLSRETALVFPFLLIAYEVLIRKDKKINWQKILPFFALLGLYAVLRLNFIELNRSVLGFIPPNIVIFTGVKIVFEYVKMLVFPFNLHMSRTMPISSGIDESVILAAIIVIPLLVLCFRLKNRRRDMFFWSMWFIIFLLPHLNVLRLNALYAEHWIYGASVGIYAIFACFLKDMMQKEKIRNASYICLAVAILYFSSLTITRNFDWKDEPSIYSNTLRYTLSPKVLSNLGVYYEINKQYDKSIKVYKKALEISPNETWYHNNISVVYFKNGDRKNAIYHIKKSLSINPNQPKMREMLAGIQMRT